MERTMKAAICREIGKPIIIEQIPIPKPTGRLLLVRVKVASLCHSDLSITSGLFGTDILPLVIGHEALSVVEELGPDAEPYGIKVGDMIGASLWHEMCLTCVDCKTVGPEFCMGMKVKGITAPGTFSEYTLVDPLSSVVVKRAGEEGQGEVGDVAGLAPLFCAGITVWDAIERAEMKPGETVAIVGVGGLGWLAARYARDLGAKVIVLDVRDEQLDAAVADGIADGKINITSFQGPELGVEVAKLNGGKLADTVIVTSGVVPAYLSAMGIVRACGQIVVVGLPSDPIPLIAGQVGLRCIKFITSKVPGKGASQRCFDFSMRRGIRSKINERKFALEDINEMFALMKAGEVDKGRMVVKFF